MIETKKTKVRRRSSIVTNAHEPTSCPHSENVVEEGVIQIETNHTPTLVLFILLIAAVVATLAANQGKQVEATAKPFRSISIRNASSTSVHALPARCEGVATPKFIAIRGERHSATNLFRQVTNKNGKFQQPCIHHNDLERCDEYLGWKHGYLNTTKDIMDENVITAVLVRDAFSWLVSMFYEPYNMVMLENTDTFGTFLKSTYDAQCEYNIDYIKDRCTFPMEQAANLLELRTSKYRNWIEYLDSPVNETKSYKWSIVRQEDLVGLEQQERTTRNFFKNHCIPSLGSNKFKVVGKFVTKSLQPNNVAQHDVLNQFTIDQLQYVLDNLDLDYEKETLGYDYTYVTEHIDQRSKGTASYEGPPTLSDKARPHRLELIEDNIQGRIPGRDISAQDAEKKIYTLRQNTIAKKMKHGIY